MNETIKPLTDLEHWGVVEHMLIESGWPREALLVTVVRDKQVEGHAVLTVTARTAWLGW